MYIAVLLRRYLYCYVYLCVPHTRLCVWVDICSLCSMYVAVCFGQHLYVCVCLCIPHMGLCVLVDIRMFVCVSV